MKKCPGCGAVDMDQDYTCGVCGSDLAGITTLDESSLYQPIAQAPSPGNRRLNLTALLTVLVGPTIVSLLALVLVLGLLELGSELVFLSGIVILLIGLLVTSATIGGGASLRRRFQGTYGDWKILPEIGSPEQSKERKKEKFD